MIKSKAIEIRSVRQKVRLLRPNQRYMDEVMKIRGKYDKYC